MCYSSPHVTSCNLIHLYVFQNFQNIYIWNVVKTFFFFRICKEFEAIQDRALKVPETTEDMIEMITYINEVKTKELEELNNKIMVSTSELFTFICS